MSTTLTETPQGQASRLYARIAAINKNRRRATDTLTIHCEIATVCYIRETGNTDAEKYQREESAHPHSADAAFAISLAAGTIARLVAQGVTPTNAAEYIEKRVAEFEANAREEFRRRR